MKDIFLGCQNECSFESITYMQHLPSVLFVLRLFFLQVHQTNIPATASAATDPNTAPTIIPMAITKCDKLQIIFSNDLIIADLPLYYCQVTFEI